MSRRDILACHSQRAAVEATVYNLATQIEIDREAVLKRNMTLFPVLPQRVTPSFLVGTGVAYNAAKRVTGEGVDNFKTVSEEKP